MNCFISTSGLVSLTCVKSCSLQSLMKELIYFVNNVSVNIIKSLFIELMKCVSDM